MHPNVRSWAGAAITANKADSGFDPGRVKTKSDLVVMLSGGQISAFFCSATFSHSLDPKRTVRVQCNH